MSTQKGHIPGQWDVMTQNIGHVHAPHQSDPLRHGSTANIENQVAINRRELGIASQQVAYDALGTEESQVGIIAGEYYQPGLTSKTYGIKGAPPHDQGYWASRAQHTTQQGLTPIGKAFVPEKFWEMLEKKQEAIFNADFNGWCLGQIPLGKEPEMDFWRKMFPDIVAAKEKSVGLELEIQKRLAFLKLRGIKTLDDWWFLYCLNQAQGAAVTETAYSNIPEYVLKNIVTQRGREEQFPAYVAPDAVGKELRAPPLPPTNNGGEQLKNMAQANIKANSHMGKELYKLEQQVMAESDERFMAWFAQMAGMNYEQATAFEQRYGRTVQNWLNRDSAIIRRYNRINRPTVKSTI